MAWGYLAMPATPETEGCLAPTRASDGSLFFFTHGSKGTKAQTEAKILVSKVKLNNFETRKRKKKANKKKQRYAIMLLLLHGGTLNMTLLYYYYNKTT